MGLFRLFLQLDVGGVTVQSIFMIACTFLEYIYGWVGVFVTMGGCDCLQHIYGWCAFLEHNYERV